MSIYGLDRLFAPKSIVIIGASARDRSVGRAVLRNLRESGFEGAISLVNPDGAEIDGIRAHKTFADVGGPPADLAVIATPGPTVPGLIADAGRRGCGAAVVLTAGLGKGPGSLSEQARQTARDYGVRLVGPNCLGVLVPRAKLNASFAARSAKTGDLALISQSGAIAAGLIDWTAPRPIGFSAIVSVGDQVDVDFGDLLDYFALDTGTRAILLYIESIKDAPKFMSAARAASRIKPVVVIKAGRHERAARAAQTHTGALAGADAVYDAAFRRAGLLRVNNLDELFSATETLAQVRPFAGKRLAILTNGGGIGVLAVDHLDDRHGELAELQSDTIAELDRRLPPYWSHANPVDIAGDADGARYAAALEVLLGAPSVDAVLVMNVATSLASPSDAAEAVAAATRAHRNRFIPGKPVFATWVGNAGEAAGSFASAGIPQYETETAAIDGFTHLVRYREALDAAFQAPPSISPQIAPDLTLVREIVNGAIANGRTWLDAVEVSAVLGAYGIDVAAGVPARDAPGAAEAANAFFAKGQRVAVKILSRDIIHKSDVHGVELNLADAPAVQAAATRILAHARELRPDARIDGVTVHPMIVRRDGRELIAGVAEDLTFGPVIAFGQGGTAVEIADDKAIALPPLDMVLAKDLIGRTRVSRMLKAYRNVPAADTEALAQVLVKLSQLAADIPEIREVDLNPLLCDENGAIAVDARISVSAVEPCAAARGSRFVIRPYPKEWESLETLPGGAAVLVRPIRPEDEKLYPTFFDRVSPEDVRLRFFAPLKAFTHAFIARLTHVDYARAMAFLALEPESGELMGVARLHADANHETAEYAILLRSDVKGRGLGWLLMQKLIDYARKDGLQRLTGKVLNDNRPMLDMCRALGFSLVADPNEPGSTVVTLDLRAAN